MNGDMMRFKRNWGTSRIVRVLGKLGKRRAAIFLAFLVGFALFGHGVYIQAKAQLAQLLIAHAWESQQQIGGIHRPWPWADTYPIAKMGVNDDPPQWVLSGANARNLAFGPTLQMNTALPGKQGNMVIYGHNDTHFAGLSQVEIGDDIAIEDASGKLRLYQIRDFNIVDESETQWIQDTDDDRLTLITCYPFNALTVNGPLRLVVIATPKDAENQVTTQNEALKDITGDVLYSDVNSRGYWL
ncbi:class GN sortase [Enterovibrio baiacu]|uniref:class GN sortase n=1 Tax=Enterovibrio baiacu TaxID=2491023 RepID=UPI00101164F1|nr:class GN sortase [Enterovibrio baiacu]MBE1274421.1 class GN sortase [Enterovibrio baiacu]